MVDRESLERAMAKYRICSERLEAAKVEGRMAAVETWRSMREDAVEEMAAALEDSPRTNSVNS